MAHATEPAGVVVPPKRGPGRPPKSATLPPVKKQKVSLPPTKASTPQTSLSAESPAPEKVTITLPAKLSATRPLPILTAPQTPSLSDSEYASIAASGVLAASLERSRASWTNSGVFERYWVKPETGKNARPPPPNNPDVKTMKSRGRCRLRIEPHILEVELYVVEKPRPPPPPKQYTPVQQMQGGYGQPFRPAQQYTPPVRQQQWQGQQSQSTASQPGSGPQTPTNSQAQVISKQKPPPQLAAHNSPSPASVPDKKPPQDPVIGMLAARAGSDPELKALMREVATGKASQAQLKVFQKHIDELSALIKAQKAKEKEEERKNIEQVDGQVVRTPDAETGQQSATPQQHTPQPRPYVAIQHPKYPLQQPYVPPPPPPPGEVVFSFTTPGATSDRFLFPQHCILEGLTAQHLLASFIVTRKGSEAANMAGLDADKEYWIPVTLMVEVAYGREGILADVRRWVKGADEVKEHMKKVMDQYERVPDSHLALRLPFKGASGIDVEESSKAATPILSAAEDKERRKSKGSSLASTMRKGEINMAVKLEEKQQSVASAQPTEKAAEQQSVQTDADLSGAKKDASSGKADTSESRRSTRATRKSSRISEE